MHQQLLEDDDDDKKDAVPNWQDASTSRLPSKNDCDPWLSRAAREILRRHLSHYLKREVETVWEAIDQLVRVSEKEEDVVAFSSCPLRGMDVLRHHEEQCRRIPSRNLPAIYASRSNNNNHGHHPHPQKDPFWYQCGACQKTFVTRFYFDRHWRLQHHPHHPDDNDNVLSPSEHPTQPIICPAHDWCLFLVDCYDVAFEREPYYSAGGGSSTDWHKQAASLVQQRIPPCHETTLQETLIACRSMVDTCFSSQHKLLQDYLLASLCAPQTCQDRLHRMLIQSSSTSGFSWKLPHPEWMVLVALFSIITMTIALISMVKKWLRRRRSDRPRSRLLQKPRHQATRYSFVSYFSNNNNEKKKQKVS